MEKQITDIAQSIVRANGQCYFVGGYVRDIIRRKNSKDIDIEVYNLAPDQLFNVLSLFGEVSPVGKSFGIYMVKGLNVDFSIPRRERKTGFNHRDFAIDVDPYMLPEKAILRRDFTINALMQNVLTGEILDFCNGQADIKNNIIRHVSNTTFTEDPLRILRGIQFAGRFGAIIADETEKMMKREVSSLIFLPKERIYEEIKKLLLVADKPSTGFRLMQKLGITRLLFPEIEALVGCKQSPVTHPEGDVFEHAMLVIDEAAKLRPLSRNPEALMWAALCHDIGKPVSTILSKDKIMFHSHHDKGEIIAKNFLGRLTAEKGLISTVSNMVKEHMTPYFIYRDNAPIRTIKRLSLRTNLSELLLLVRADILGRKIPNAHSDADTIEAWFNKKTKGLALGQGILPLVQGRHLIALGYKPGPMFGNILKEAFKRQLEGAEFDELIMFVKKEKQKT